MWILLIVLFRLDMQVHYVRTRRIFPGIPESFFKFFRGENLQGQKRKVYSTPHLNLQVAYRPSGPTYAY